MSLSALSGDEAGIIFIRLCDAIDPRVAVDFSSASCELWAALQAARQQLREQHEEASALCHKVGLQTCKELRDARVVDLFERPSQLVRQDILSADLATLGRLSSVLPALVVLRIQCSDKRAAYPDGVQRLAAGLVAGALPALTRLFLYGVYVGAEGASALAAALGRGALPKLKTLCLNRAAICDAGLLALAPVLRGLTALEVLDLHCNMLGDEGLAALLAPPLPAGALSPPKRVLTKLKELDLRGTRITYAGYAALAAELNSGVLPALDNLEYASRNTGNTGEAPIAMLSGTNGRPGLCQGDCGHV
eukprot:CAMPEP_0119097166 /NCGR_PEP_ID=MMETSP1178-20130426/175249_1 /TAXON_ID=33656 /ORGANISM="unid sp, Strain CCMP2000" /LENGTH=305 /DNA_ID=CAMNT_0007081093 /DNA_START=72 /DNA_END=990 /DNA_ORIENTATION=+